MELAEVREFIQRLGPAATRKLLQGFTGVPVRMSQAIIIAIDDAARQCTVKEFGDPGVKTNVAWNSYGVIPKLGEPVWLLKWGNDGMIVGASSGIMWSTPNMGRVPSAQIERTSNFTVPNNTSTAIPMQSKVWDTDDMVHDSFPGTNPTRIVPQRVGLYRVTGGGTWSGNNVGRRIFDLKWIGADFIVRSSMQEPATGTGDAGHVVTRDVWIVGPGAAPVSAKGGLGNGFELVVHQTSGADLDIGLSVPCFLSCHYIGPEP